MRQGEILSNVVQVHISLESVDREADWNADRKVHPYAIVLSQDCDLENDFSARQKGEEETLPSILFCEVNAADQVHARSGLGTKEWKKAKQNKEERYQFLRAMFPEEDALQQGVVEMAIDFKRYFTINTAEVYLRVRLQEARRRAVLRSPYLEHLSSRFANYLCRVGLPEDHFA